MTRESVQRNISPPVGGLPPPDRGLPGLASPPVRRRRCQRQDTTPPSQTVIFPRLAPLLVFAVLVTGLLLELCARLAPPLQPLCVSAIFTVHGNNVAQRALIWAEARWPGLWAFPVLCVGALAALRAAIWAGVAVEDSLEERGLPGVVDGLRVGSWEDGGRVSGGDLWCLCSRDCFKAPKPAIIHLRQ